MTETPSHAELVAAIEQARPLHWRTREADDERRAHLDTLTELLAYDPGIEAPALYGDELRDEIAAALKRMGAL